MPDLLVEGAHPESGAAPDLIRQYLSVLRRRRWLITLVTIVAAVVCVGYALRQPEIYTADTVLLIERRPARVIDIEDLISDSPSERDYHNTQFEILRSRSLAARVIEQEGLSAANRQGTPASVEFRPWDSLDSFLTWLRGALPSRDPGMVSSLSVGAYRANLDVRPIPNTRLVRISFTSRDPELAARIANAHAGAFIQRGLELHSDASQAAQVFLDDTLADLKRRLDESEAALGAFRHDRGIVSLDESGGLVLDQLGDLTSRLSIARERTIALERQVAAIRRNEAASLPTITSSGTLVRLQEELDQLTTRRRMQAVPNPLLEEQSQQLASRIEQEIERAAAGIESSYRTALATVRNLETEIGTQKSSALDLKDTAVEYGILAREVDTNRQLYDAVLQRRKELGMAADLRTSNVFVIDEALAPREPSSPAPARRILFGLAVALAAGVGTAAAAEFLNNRVESPTDVEQLLGIPHLGTIPDFLTGRSTPVPASKEDAGALVPVDRPLGGRVARSQDPERVLESYRAIRTNILLSRAQEPPKTILFASAAPGEGKTITALNVAATLARMGAPVLVIDADLRRPRSHELLARERSPGLTEVLAGQCEPDDVIQHLGKDFAFLDAGAQTPPDPVGLLGSQRMRGVLQSLSARYSFIVIDGSPLLPVSDTVALSPLVDGVVLVIGPKTPKPDVVRAHAKLGYARARVLGAVLNRFDLRSTGESYGYSS